VWHPQVALNGEQEEDLGQFAHSKIIGIQVTYTVSHMLNV
jgi:hypothetical protein